MNKNFIKSLVLSTVLLFVSSVPVFADTNVSRISGSDRYETTINANKKCFNRAYGNVAVITSGKNFKYALYGSQLASALNIPYYVNGKHGIRKDILNELDRLKVKRAYVVGDYQILDSSIDNTLKSKGIKVERIYDGIHEHEDASYIIDCIIFNTFHYGENKGDIGMAIFVNDKKFPDLLSVIPLSSLLARNQKKVLMSSHSSFFGNWPYLNNSKFEIGGGLIIGGYNSVTSNIMTFEGEGIGLYDHSYYNEKTELIHHHYTGRIAGENRYETAVEIAKAYELLLEKNIKTAVIVNGEDFPDALSSGIISYNTNGIVLLTQPNKLNAHTAEYIKDCNIKNIIIVGGENSVSKNVENELKSLN